MAAGINHRRPFFQERSDAPRGIELLYGANRLAVVAEGATEVGFMTILLERAFGRPLRYLF